MSEMKRLYRSRTNRVIGGVCAGLGEYFSIDPMLFRLAFGILALVNGLGLLIYLIIWVIVPDETNRELGGEDLVRSNIQDIGEQAKRLGTSFRNAPQGTLILGVILIVLGALFLLNNLVPGINPGLLWPIALIAIGVLVLFARR